MRFTKNEAARMESTNLGRIVKPLTFHRHKAGGLEVATLVSDASVKWDGSYIRITVFVDRRIVASTIAVSG